MSTTARGNLAGTTFNNQVWHRGDPSPRQQMRYRTLVSYSRRAVGHRYFPFSEMPAHLHAGADAGPRLKRLLGFLPTGPYG